MGEGGAGGGVAARAIVSALSVVGWASPNRPRGCRDPGAGGAGILSEFSRLKQENSERFIVLRAYFDARSRWEKSGSFSFPRYL